ncbi:Gfo/Idh/MocA family oxidoreductase [Pseudonocardia sp. KRD-184]|uniref:Gfo/Idh/MocA family oxidoreductase n=1 Tax=Pseudonocardia oceani TaxID=2792013 RepID=A0ABS6UJM7_9PSEU|nr:Gfo/Idh/MocA family oxidoreductase [Pseudonocardia oceani]MBW0093654.1 Gfo/Idh/MocA family oxidoreductase [Pseudonocardia oceani]MBW0098495.1 Gfo/Idh/MocA family oxidoreductase [Pseudonocardia oceani]MBW0110987.1 Gfo/Idh/MocA family oxidoreductase [Pseudonocardia oceani]MBW0124995.1 Gfo/Idh/MocA family oxidoreductase [Pseudonocardia oceani]MBW0132429.1 Gfo/Idh/MocA family oxidoreductase [Pseudonocardia oceani]
MTMARPGLGVGMVGHAFMGAAHSQAWRTAGRFFDLPLTPDMAVLCGRNAETARAAADRLGWRDVETDWKDLLTRDDVQLVDVCTPGDTHAEIAIAALDAGKHVLCEKPLANTVDEARAMVAAAQRAQASGVRSMVGFNYRRVPAVSLARRLVEQGRIGEVRHVRASYLQDWIVDPEAPLVWRLQAERAGSGALGDIGAHVVDLAQFVTGDRLSGVSGLTETFVRERPLPSGEGRGPVTVDDAALFVGRFGGGALASFEATRFATGRKNQIRLEVNGSAGSLAFDFEQMNELQFFDGTDDPDVAGFRRILVTEPGHPYAGAWWPPGHGLGYEHTFTHEVVDLVRDVAAGTDPVPSFADGLQVQLVLDAVVRSAAAGSGWQAVEES